MNKHICPKCKKIYEETNYYRYKNNTRCFDMCKKCLTENIDNFNPNTFLWLLKKFNIPFVEGEWNIIRDYICKKRPESIKDGRSVFGRYLERMKLKGWRGYSWKDTALLNGYERDQSALDGVPAEEGELE